MFIVVLVTIVKEMETKYELMNGYRKCAIYTMQYYSTIKKNLVICGHMNGTGDHVN
jgi:hypothetical protein